MGQSLFIKQKPVSVIYFKDKIRLIHFGYFDRVNIIMNSTIKNTAVPLYQIVDNGEFIEIYNLPILP